MGIGVEITIEQEGEIHVVAIEGRLDASTTPVVEKKLANLFDVSTKLLFNFGEVSYLSSAGMRLLLSITKKFGSKGGKMAIYGMNSDVMEIVKMAGFERVLHLYKAKKEAIASLG